MCTKIAHISDVHFERLSQAVSDQLTKALTRLKPDILVFTGDLVDNYWNIKKAKQWLLGLCADIGISADTHLLVVPGNHDYRVLGNVGFRPFTGYSYRRHFRQWNSKRLILYPDHRICFFRIDSNPVMFGWAKGVVRRRQLQQIEMEWESLNKADRDLVADSTKIALVHHHPLPVPYEGGDTFLMLEKAQNLIQFLAEHRIDCVLHGHKHRAPFSLLSLGTCIGKNRVVTVVGAGTAVAGGTDREARGHNFNMVTAEKTGLFFVQQYFAQPGDEFRESAPSAHTGEILNRVYLKGLIEYPYKYDRIDSFMRINSEGDVFNELSYSGLRATGDQTVPELSSAGFYCTTGHISHVRLNPARTSEGVDLHFLNHQKQAVEFVVKLQRPVTASAAADFSLQHSEFNSVALYKLGFQRKYPAKAEPPTEFEEIEITEPTDQLSVTLAYPSGYQPAYRPRFEVGTTRTPQDDKGGSQFEVHRWLTDVLQPAFHYSEQLNVCLLSIHRPPIGYLYRITWQLPGESVSSPEQNPAHAAAVAQFTNLMLNLRRPENADLLASTEKVLDVFAKLVATQINTMLQSSSCDSSGLEVSLMVCNDRDEGVPPTLQVVASTHAGVNSFTLEIGDGNAGRAYSGNKLRIFDAVLARENPIYETYVQRLAIHHFLYSMPLRHPQSQHLIFGVLNIGSFSPVQGDLIKALNTDEGNTWLLSEAHSYLLKRLLEVAKM